MAPALLDLPHEVLHSIFTLIDPADLAALTCCRTLAKFLQTDKLLYKELYLNNFVSLEIKAPARLTRTGRPSFSGR